MIHDNMDPQNGLKTLYYVCQASSSQYIGLLGKKYMDVIRPK